MCFDFHHFFSVSRLLFFFFSTRSQPLFFFFFDEVGFCTKDSELKSVFFSKKPMSVLLYKEMLLEINDLDSSLPSIVSSLLQEFKYVIPEDDPGD